MGETGCKAKGLKTIQKHKLEKKTDGKTEGKEKQGNTSIDTVKQRC